MTLGKLKYLSLILNGLVRSLCLTQFFVDIGHTMSDLSWLIGGESKLRDENISYNLGTSFGTLKPLFSIRSIHATVARVYPKQDQIGFQYF